MFYWRISHHYSSSAKESYREIQGEYISCPLLCSNIFSMISCWKAQTLTFDLPELSLYLCLCVLSWIKRVEEEETVGLHCYSTRDKKGNGKSSSITFLYIIMLLFHDLVKNFKALFNHCIFPLGLENVKFSQNLAPTANTNWTLLQGQFPTFHITAPPSTDSADIAQIVTDLSGFLCMIQQNDKI